MKAPPRHEEREEEDDAGAAWACGIAREWSDELADSKQDLYTPEDRNPVEDGV